LRTSVLDPKSKFAGKIHNNNVVFEMIHSLLLNPKVEHVF
jgi:phosphoribosylformylglycinamidine (FGAM) synthase PurS component